MVSLHDAAQVFLLQDTVFGITHAAPVRAPQDAPFVSGDAARRMAPSAHLAEARGVIVAALPPVRLPLADIADDAVTRTMPFGAARLSSLVTMRDYHPRVRRTLNNLRKLFGMSKRQVRIFVDSPYLDERALASRAGLGFIGKNNMLITPEFGSWCNIGIMLTTLAPDVLIQKFLCAGAVSRPHAADACPSSCSLCLDACPLSPSVPTPFTCRSYLTQKSSLTSEEERLIFPDIFGCDECQNACPRNKPVAGVFVCASWLAGLADCELNEIFKGSACLWRGVGVLRRNAAVVGAH